jgi:hypothetical protein
MGQKTREGVVVGYGRRPDTVGVLFDGTRTRRTFHVDYIDHVPEVELDTAAQLDLSVDLNNPQEG